MTQTRPRKYADVWERIVANCESAPGRLSTHCWQFTGSKKCRFGYGRMNFYIPGLGKTVALSVHILAFLSPEIDEWQDIDALYLAYLEVRHSGLQLDHECVNPSCCRPSHLQFRTGSENCQLRELRKQEVMNA